MRSTRITPSRGRNGPPGRWLWAALSLAAALLGEPRLAAAADVTVTVMLDRAQLVPFPDATETVIVGNPIIADITMLRNTGQVIVTGKGFGDTNLLFIDGHGALLSELRLRVREAPAMMVVQRGMDRETYACHPRCQPTVALGDSTAYLTRSISDIQSRNAQATGAAAAGAQAH